MAITWRYYPTPDRYDEVTPERWAWVALYSDNTFLEQFDRNGFFHKLQEVDQSRLAAFQMVNLTGLKPPVMIYWKPGRKLIHFYRNIALNVGTPEEVHVRLYCFGYETDREKVIVVIMPNDEVRIVEDVNQIQVV